jgi:hypothetical protein
MLVAKFSGLSLKAKPGFKLIDCFSVELILIFAFFEV